MGYGISEPCLWHQQIQGGPHQGQKGAQPGVSKLSLCLC